MSTASEVTTLWRYRNECIIIIIISPQSRPNNAMFMNTLNIWDYTGPIRRHWSARNPVWLYFQNQHSVVVPDTKLNKYWYTQLETLP